MSDKSPGRRMSGQRDHQSPGAPVERTGPSSGTSAAGQAAGGQAASDAPRRLAWTAQGEEAKAQDESLRPDHILDEPDDGLITGLGDLGAACGRRGQGEERE